MTLELPDESPVRDLPWIITFGPLNDDEDWEPVVCGPYERRHALALAEDVVADDELMAVVEPLMAFTEPDEMRAEVAVARGAAAAAAAAGDESADVIDELDGGDLDGHQDHGAHDPAPVPDPAEVRAGMARVAARFAGGPQTSGERG